MNRLERLRAGKNRENIVKVFKIYFKNLSDKTILDVGCGCGSLLIHFSKFFKKVYGIDNNKKEIEIAKKILNKNKINNVIIKKENALYIPTTEKYDIIHLSGVFEWLRLGNLNKSARECQEFFLKNIKKNMKDNGILYSGTENKLFPFFWIRDPHNAGLPLTAILPDKLSDIIYKKLKNKKYPTKIYSYWGLKKMFKKYFKNTEFYVPIPHYQYVLGFAKISDKKRIIKECNRILRTYNLDRIQKLETIWIKYITWLGLIKIFSLGFITVSKN